MNKDTKDTYNFLKKDYKEKIFTLADVFRERNHHNAMEIITSTQKQLSKEFTFKHYILKDAIEEDKTTTNIKEVFQFIAEKSTTKRLEVIACLECKQETLERSILYFNPFKKIQFINGKEFFGKLNYVNLLETFSLYQK